MKAYVTCMSSGQRCLITKYQPIFEKVAGSDRVEPYCAPGEPLGIPACMESMQRLIGVSLLPLEMQKIVLTARLVGESFFE